MKAIRFHPNVPAEVRAIEQKAAMTILEAIHRYAETGAGRVKPLSGEFEGVLRLRASAITASSSMKPPTPSPSTAFSTARTLTAERRTPKTSQIKSRSNTDQRQITSRSKPGIFEP